MTDACYPRGLDREAGTQPPSAEWLEPVLRPDARLYIENRCVLQVILVLDLIPAGGTIRVK